MRVAGCPSLVLRLTLLCLALATAQKVIAQDEALYDAPLPDDAAFVRFIGFDEGSSVDLFGMSFPEARVARQEYNVLRANALDALEPGDILTVIPAHDGDALILSEPARTERKVLIRLLNLSADNTVGLWTADGQIEIISATEQNAMGAREVNAIQVEVAVLGREGKIGETISLALRSDRHVTFVVSSEGEVVALEDLIIPEPFR